MIRCNDLTRRTRLSFVFAPMACCALAASAAAPGEGEQCIVGDHAIGCSSERAIVELTMPRKDAGALQRLLQDKLASGQCRLFDYGERVQVTSSQGSERMQIRRPGDKSSYWIAASWARPAADCDGTRSASALHHKLGVPDLPAEPADADDRDPSFAAERVRSFADQRTAPGQYWNDGDEDDDGDDARYSHDRRRPPPLASRPLPSSRYAHDCAYKSVMTDAELLACRNPQR